MRQVLLLAVLIAAAFGLAACGRNGPPLLPAGPVAAAPAPAATAAPLPPGSSADANAAQATAAKNGFDAFGNPVAPPGQKKSFLLDPLLGPPSSTGSDAAGAPPR